ncbi:hypothetical protein STEG23_006987, partial [Scotinomys teguina]
MNINTDPSRDCTMDPDMILGSSQDSNVTVVLVGSTSHLNQHGPNSSVAFKPPHGPRRIPMPGYIQHGLELTEIQTDFYLLNARIKGVFYHCLNLFNIAACSVSDPQVTRPIQGENAADRGWWTLTHLRQGQDPGEPEEADSCPNKQLKEEFGVMSSLLVEVVVTDYFPWMLPSDYDLIWISCSLQTSTNCDNSLETLNSAHQATGAVQMRIKNANSHHDRLSQTKSMILTDAGKVTEPFARLLIRDSTPRCVQIRFIVAICLIILSGTVFNRKYKVNEEICPAWARPTKYVFEKQKHENLPMDSILNHGTNNPFQEKSKHVFKMALEECIYK